MASDRFAPPRRVRPLAYTAALVLAVLAGGVAERVRDDVSAAASERNVLVADLVDTHVRSLMASHLTDVQSSDHHTVKPWFAGKVTFAPPAPELQLQGFPLVGGRVEYVAGRTAAALVYGRGLHTINLFIWPEHRTRESAPRRTADGREQRERELPPNYVGDDQPVRGGGGDECSGGEGTDSES